MASAIQAIRTPKSTFVRRLDYGNARVFPKPHFSALTLASDSSIKVGFYQNNIFYCNGTADAAPVSLANSHKERLIHLYVNDKQVTYTFKYSQIERLVYCEGAAQLLMEWAFGTGPQIYTFEGERTLSNPLHLTEKDCHALLLTIQRDQDIHTIMNGIFVQTVASFEIVDMPNNVPSHREPIHSLDVELMLESLILTKIPKRLITDEFNEVINRADEERLKYALRLLMRNQRGFILDPTKEIKLALVKVEQRSIRQSLRSRLMDSNDAEYMRLFALEITPTKWFLTGPMIDRSNRVLRKYQAHSYHFIRVTFRDDDGNKLNAINSELQQYISDKLKNGVTLAGK